MESVDKRKQEILRWLYSIPQLQKFSISQLMSDASFRRYFRVATSQRSYIVMDAPPTQENCHNFIAIAQALRKMGIQTPEIIAAKLDMGFLLLTDFGDHTYLKTLNPDNASELYGRALQTLAVMQRLKEVPGLSLPFFNHDWMWQEWAWHKEWFLEKFLHLDFHREEKKLDDCFSLLVQSAINQPQVFIHRDYHAANLMVLEQDMGVLDFQDAFIGPITYDVVSLLRDCYISWPDQLVYQWAKSYWQMLHEFGLLAPMEFEIFLRWFDWMGLERHLKALFTFARKHVRDQHAAYLNHVPRTLNYLIHVSSKYEEFSALTAFLEHTVRPAFSKELSSCAR